MGHDGHCPPVSHTVPLPVGTDPAPLSNTGSLDARPGLAPSAAP
ncbi:hypothetical protein OG613_00990 [Streptomyces sp. NBC_00015]